ncbi:MAG TPA: hypothetical protein VF763_14325 [Candidatus Limnocylindrales bacterium]
MSDPPTRPTDETVDPTQLPLETEPAPAGTPGVPPAVLDYVRRYGDRYTASQLRYQLEQAGHDEATIEAALRSAGVTEERRPTGWARYGSSAVGQPIGPNDHPRPRREPLTVLGVLVAFLVGGYATIWLVGTVAPNVAVLVAGVILVAGLVGWASLRETSPSVASGLGWGVLAAVGLPTLAVLVLFGLCVAGAIRPY